MKLLLKAPWVKSFTDYTKIKKIWPVAMWTQLCGLAIHGASRSLLQGSEIRSFDRRREKWEKAWAGKKKWVIIGPPKKKYWTNLRHSCCFFTSTLTIELKGKGFKSGTSDRTGTWGLAAGWLTSKTYGLTGIDGIDMVSRCLGPQSKWFEHTMQPSSIFNLL